VCFIGFTQSGSVKSPFPYELEGMVILKCPDGRKTLLKAKRIQMIEVPESGLN
jgi:hypothetical protein